MPSRILSGTIISRNILEKLSNEILKLQSQQTFNPKFAIVQVGNRHDSNIYVGRKINASKLCGIQAQHILFPQEVREEELFEKIFSLNKDESIHGIIVQLPLDSLRQLPVETLLDTIDPYKDVDGLTSIQVSRLVKGIFMGNEMIGPTYLPCTPAACLALLQETGVSLKGKRCLIVGYGRLVGAPLVSLLIWAAKATITIFHEFSHCLEEEVARADILITAVGKSNLVNGAWIRPGAIVIDCGISISPSDDATSGKQKVMGDVHFESAFERAAWITPVPGGVGPVTVAMLLKNTFTSALWHYGLIDFIGIQESS